jgi:hypothetical protein
VVVALAAFVLCPGRAAGDELPPARPTFFPRFTLIELQYPQVVAASAGVWAWLPVGSEHRPGVVGDVELGIGGATFALGPGVSTAPHSHYENGWSLGVQGVVHKPWSWWSPWLPTSSTFAGGELFAHLFAYRCSLGVMWNVAPGGTPARVFTGGCGLGWP